MTPFRFTFKAACHPLKDLRRPNTASQTPFTPKPAVNHIQCIRNRCFIAYSLSFLSEMIVYASLVAVNVQGSL